ncbi:alpha/beta fold hydrolase [Thermaurantiacus sp.]
MSLLLALTASPLLAAPAAPLQSLSARLPDGRTLAFRCAGHGAPTVIFESGWAADGRAWGRVIGPVADVTRACVYDRAGSGGSTMGPLPRDGRAIAADLEAGLKALRISPPYLLVAHSAGALYARAFAQARPREMAGLILVDPTIAHQEQRLTAALGQPAGSVAGFVARSRRCLEAVRAGPLPAEDKALAPCAVAPPLDPVVAWQTRLSEVETLDAESSGLLDGRAGALGAMPLVILGAMRDLPPPAAEVRRRLLKEEAAISTLGEVREVADSGHMMMRDKPEAIVEAVTAMVAAARKARPPAAKGR